MENKLKSIKKSITKESLNILDSKTQINLKQFLVENQRAGLWAVCKSKIDFNSPKYIISNEFENTHSLARKLKRTKDEKPRAIEECHAKFLLKDGMF